MKNSPQSTPQPNKHTKSLVIIGAVALVTIMVAIIVAIYLTMFHVSKKDYVAFESTLSDVRMTYNSLTEDLEAYRRTIADSKRSDQSEAKQRAEQSLAAYSKSVDDLADMKALQDGSIQRAYDDYIEKNPAFVAYVAAIIKDVEVLQSIIDDCSVKATTTTSRASNNPDELVATFDASFKKCDTHLAKIKDSDVTALRDLSRKLTALYTERRQTYVDLVQALKNNDAQGIQNAQAENLEYLTKFTDALQPIVAEVQVQENDVAVREQLIDLRNTVEAKTK